ncbi:hypothetical protein HY29_17940 [Hyphomonas beringensis]|uniref:Uncharacterized protein n=1 Tax=Hyphomonas beringensis TaxID=1280946 RepID=A0A062U4Y2_9PROT|nr:hypothetical protein HY29_17940 [Hyphomonas beringensis]
MPMMLSVGWLRFAILIMRKSSTNMMRQGTVLKLKVMVHLLPRYNSLLFHSLV